MGKWVFGLCVSLYAVLILFGGEGYQPEAVANAAPEPVVDVAGDAEASPVEEVEVTRAAVEISPADASPAPSDVGTSIAELGTVAVVPDVQTASLAGDAVKEPARPRLVLNTTDTAQTPDATEAAPAAQLLLPETTDATSTPSADPTSPVGQIWTVTGNRVNLRAGASTQNGVVGQTVRGESAEIVEMLENGWAKVYILDTGIEAYMSADFLSPEQG